MANNKCRIPRKPGKDINSAPDGAELTAFAKSAIVPEFVAISRNPDYKTGGVTSPTKIKLAVIDLFQTLGSKYEPSEYQYISDAVDLVSKSVPYIKSILPPGRVKTLLTIRGSAESVSDRVFVSNILDDEDSEYDAVDFFLKNAFGSVVAAKDRLERKMTNVIISSFIINRSEGTIVSNIQQANQNIEKHKRNLLKDIQQYFITHNIESGLVSEDIDTASVKTIISKYRKQISELLQVGMLEETELQSLYDSSLNMHQAESDRLKAKTKLDAYGSWLALQYFDNFVKMTLGDTIIINPSSPERYSYSVKGTNMNTTWRKDDNIDLQAEINKLTQALINSSPMFAFQSKTPLSDAYMEFGDFSYMTAKVKDLVYDPKSSSIFFSDKQNAEIWNTLSEDERRLVANKSFRHIISSSRYNPQKYLPLIYKILVSGNNSTGFFIDRFTNFHKQDKNILWSIHMNIYNAEDVKADHSSSVHSLYRIQKINPDSKNYFAAVSSVADCIFSVDFAYYTYEDGVLRLRSLRDAAVDKTRREIENVINNKNSKVLTQNFDFTPYNVKELDKDGNAVTTESGLSGITFKLDVSTPNKPGHVYVHVLKMGEIVKLSKSENPSGPEITNFAEFDDNPKVLQFFDEVLGLNFTQNPELRIAYKELTTERVGNRIDSVSPYLKQMFAFTGHIFFNRYFSKKYLYDLDTRSKKKAMIAKYFEEESRPRFNNQFFNMEIIPSKKYGILVNLAQALGTTRGLNSSRQVRDSENAALSSQTLSRLLGNMAQQMDIQINAYNTLRRLELELDELYEQYNSASDPLFQEGYRRAIRDKQEEIEAFKNTSCLLDTPQNPAASHFDIITKPGLFQGVVKSEEIKGLYGSKKQVKFTTAEAIMSSFIHNFVLGHCSKSTLESKSEFGDGIVGLLPSVNSDKTTVSIAKFNLKTKVTITKNGVTSEKTYMNLTNEELMLVIAEQIGNFYNKLYDNVKEDFANLLPTIVAYNQEHNLNLPEFNPDTNFAELNAYIEDYNASLPAGNAKLKASTILQEIITKHNKQNPTKQIRLIDQIHYITNNNGSIKFNNTIKALKHRFSSTEATKEFFDLKSTEVLKSVIGSGFSLNLYGNANLDKQPEIAYLRNEKKYKGWINMSGQMVIAKANINGKVYDITNNNDLKTVEKALGISDLFNNIHALAGKIQLHPMLEKYNLMDYLFTQQFMYSTVGSHVAHPAKAKIKTPVIWAHPGIGKTHLIEDGTYSHRFMDWDVEFNRRRDSWIAQHSNTEIGTPEFKEARSDYQMKWRKIPEYQNFVKREWSRIKQKANDENKILVASPHMLLELFADEFSSVLTMSKEAFITRSTQRGDSDPSGWKHDLDITISSLMANPVFASKVKQIQDHEYLTSLVETGQLQKELALLRDNEMAEEASRFYAQHKRNVSFTAAMDQFQLNQKDGIPTWYNIAVIKDIKQNLFTVDGYTNDAKPYDGATFVNPFIVYLENHSLNEARAGIDKKQFVHYYDELTGTGGIIKTAGFGVTNDRMRNSEFYRDIMKNMTSRKWRTATGELYYGDITKDFKGNEIDYGTFYFKRGSKYYKAYITSEIKQVQNPSGEIVERPVYYRHETEITENGGIVGTQENVQEFLIDNNYDLWQLFGGMHSQEFNGDVLEPSETSIQNVVKAMNNHGIRKPGWTEDDITAEFIDQPLKNSDIHYMPTEGAVKQGIANVNPNTHYRGSHELSSFRIRMTNAGIQLDKEHHADGSKLSLMTQVISAACSMGYTPAAAKKLYTALYNLTLQGIKPFITSFRKSLDPNNEMDKSAFEVAIAECMVKNMVTSTAQDGDMLRAIATDLIAKVRRGGKLTAEDAKTIAYSEPTVFNKLVSNLSSIMTKAGIKAKMDGILSVLCPTQGIVKMYDFIDDTGVRHTLTLSQLEAKYAHLYTDSDTDESFLKKVLDTIQSYQKPITSNQITVGKKYTIKFADRIDSLGNVIEGKEIVVDVTYPHDTGSIKGSHGENVGYQAIKNLVKNGHAVYGTVETIHEYVKEGNDLKAVNYTFNDLEGNSYQVWDIDFIQDLFEVIKTTSDLENVDDKIAVYEDLIKKYDGNSLDKFNEAVELNYTTYQNAGNIKETFIKEHRLRLLKRYAKHLQQNILFSLSKNNPDKSFPIKIGGKDVTVDKKSINIDAYEIVMPKVFLEEFGLDNYTNLDEIIHNKDYFYNRMVSNFDTKVLDPTHYDLELKVTNGKHIYIKDRSGISDNWNSDLEKVTIHKSIDELGQVWRMDLVSGKKMYQLFDENDEVYRIPETGVEIILTSTNKVTDSEGISSIESGISHYLDIFKYQSLHISSAVAAGKNLQLSKNNRPKFENLLEIIQKSENKCAQSWIKLFKNRKKKDAWVENMVELNEELNDFNRLKPSLQRYLKKQAANMHTSLLKSLDIIAARIPAQNQQSFMPMKVVAFDNPNINTAYVSVMQFFLQGSDLDIDAVSLLTFSFSPSGEFYAWSPDFNLQDTDMLNLSLNIPFPTGYDLKVVNYETLEEEVHIADRKPLLNKNEHYLALLQEQDRINNLSEEELSKIDLDPALQEREYLAKQEALKHYIALLEFINDNSGVVYFDSVEIESSDFSKQLIKRINKHNKYLLKAGDKVTEGATKNYVVGALYSVATDPANWLEAHTGVDIATGPLKAIANKSELSKVQQTFTPGNVFNKFQAIEEASVGKDDIAICATGLKGFFAATQFCNDHLNKTIQDPNIDENTLKDLARIVTFNPITIGGKTFTSLANIRVDNLEKVNPNSEIYTILRNRGFDEDASVIMSALLSLSTDNAKDLALAKINAGTGMISLYLYGAAIGMDFQILNKIIASPLGFTVAKLLNSDEFANKQGKLSVDSALTYLTKGPTRSDFKRFNGTIRMPKKNLKVLDTVDSVLETLSLSDVAIESWKNEDSKNKILTFKNTVKEILGVYTDSELAETLGLDEEHPNLNTYNVGKLIAKIVSERGTQVASNLVSAFRNAFNERVDGWAIKQKRGFKALGNQLFDFLNEFVGQTATLHNNDYETEYGISNITVDLNKLALGADEFKRLGQFLRLNQEIKTKPDELIGFAQKMETLLTDRVKVIKNTISRIGSEHLGIADVDILKGITTFDFKEFAESFINDESSDSFYKQQIEIYEQACKSCINPLRILTSVDHYKGYFTSMILAYEGDYTKSIKFRAIKHLGNQFMTYANISKPSEKLEVYKNVQTFVDDYINNAYLRSRNPIELPQKSESLNVKVIDVYGEEFDNDDIGTEIQLGTEFGNATLEHFFENVFIPELKKQYPGNKFVQELTSVLITDPITKTHLTAVTLPINMMPSSDNERILFNKYKNDFNKISDELITIGGISYSILDMFHYYNLIKFRGKVGRSSLARIFEDKTPRHQTFVEYRSFINSFDEGYDFVINDEALTSIPTDKSIILVDPELLATYLAPTANYRIASAKIIKHNDLETGKVILLKKKEKQSTSENYSNEDVEHEGLASENVEYIDDANEAENNMVEGLELNSDENIEESQQLDYEGYEPMLESKVLERFNSPSIQAVEALDFPIASHTIDGTVFKNIVISDGVLKQFVYNGKTIKIESTTQVIKMKKTKLGVIYQIDEETLNSIIGNSLC